MCTACCCPVIMQPLGWHVDAQYTANSTGSVVPTTAGRTSLVARPLTPGAEVKLDNRQAGQMVYSTCMLLCQLQQAVMPSPSPAQSCQVCADPPAHTVRWSALSRTCPSASIMRHPGRGCTAWSAPNALQALPRGAKACQTVACLIHIGCRPLRVEVLEGLSVEQHLPSLLQPPQTWLSS